MNRDAAKVDDPGEVPPPTRSVGDWIKYLFFSLRFVFIVTEMDLPLWGSIALLTQREDLLFIYLGIMSVPYSLFTLFRRGFSMYRAEAAFRADPRD